MITNSFSNIKLRTFTLVIFKIQKYTYSFYVLILFKIFKMIIWKFQTEINLFFSFSYWFIVCSYKREKEILHATSHFKDRKSKKKKKDRKSNNTVWSNHEIYLSLEITLTKCWQSKVLYLNYLIALSNVS